jgi:ABC-2 type transport system permease protein
VTLGGQNSGATFDPLQYFAPSMAVFFLTFTMAGGVVGIIEERDRWTLQRMLSSPTSRLTILAGKFGGTYLNGLLQLSVLIVATSLIGPILGSKNSVWGSNIPGIILITLAAVAAAVGLGTLVAGFAKSAQQADTISNAVLILSGLLGGSFFNVASFGPALQVGSKLTLNYWATNAYNTLAQTGDIAAVLPNIAVLLLMFAVYFGVGVMLFNRRLDV